VAFRLLKQLFANNRENVLTQERSIKSMSKITIHGEKKKTGHEAGQYFHVRPPSASYEWAIKHKRNRENHRNTSAIKSVLSHFRPVSHLRDNRFRHFFVRRGSFSVKDDKITAKLRKYDIRGMSHFRTSVLFWEQQSPRY